jgi:ribosomal protein S20
MIFTGFIMLPMNNNKKKVHRALSLTIVSLSVVSLIIIMNAANYSSAQVSDGQNATSGGGVSSTTSTGMNTITSPTITLGRQNQSTTAEIRTFIEQAHMSVRNNDIQGALMNLNSAIVALDGGDGEQANNMTTMPNKVTDSTTTTEAGTIGSGGAGGAGTAGGIITGGGT